ncbi:hypothetical protein Pfo_010143 [Paulownia fortunei]|nr:hypothetical protein Pfo_010143 [Paulownia fortunei]
MDYDDNDYESQNLHLAGEESSKISSVLRPFALPKFDFDDSLHGHMRFGSLVENEVFLSIPSQEDNQWIEDFSRGSSGIEFSSGAADSCALLRRNNVWSEATSSESVEMLLKAVGLEEMVPGENMIEESDPGDQLGSSSKQMECNLRLNDRMDGVDDGNPLLLPAEVQGNFSRSYQDVGIEGVLTKYTVQVQETKFCYQLCDDSQECSLTVSQECSLTVTGENMPIDVKSTSDNQGETCGLMNESLIEQVQENLPVHGIEIDNMEGSSQKITESVRESGDQDKVSDINFISSSCIEKGISEGVEEQEEGCNTQDENFGGSAAETVKSEPLEILPQMKSTGEHAVEIRVNNSAEASSMPGNGESVSTVDGCNEFAFVVEPAGGSECETAVFSSGTEIKQQAEGCTVLCEDSSVSLKEGHTEGLGIKGSDAVTPSNCVNSVLKQVPVTQPSDQFKNPVGNEHIFPGNNEASHVESSMLPKVLGNPSEHDSEGLINHADARGYSTDSSFAVECCGQKSLIEEISERDVTAIGERNVEDGDHLSRPLLTGSTKTREDVLSMRVAVHEHDLDVSACEKEDMKLPLNSSHMVCDDNEKGVASTFSGEGVQVNVKTATVSQSNTLVGDYPSALTLFNTEVEDTKLTSSCVKGDELADSHEHNTASCDSWKRDQSKDTEFEAIKEQSTSISKESLEGVDELVPTIETEKGALPDSAAAGRTKAVDQSVSLVKTSSAAMHDEGSQELNEKMEHPASDAIVHVDGAEAAATEKPTVAEIERSSETNFSIVSVTSCVDETGESNELSASSISCIQLSQSGINKQENLERNDVEIVGKALSTSTNSGVHALSKEEGTFTFDIRPLGGQSAGDSGKGLQLPSIQTCKLSPTPPGGLKGPSEPKTRRGSVKSGKESAKKGNQVKETIPLRQTGRGDESHVSFSPLGSGQVMTFESVVRPSGAVSIPTSNLPDLNTSAPSSAFFQQPFSDLQQVQLRAQIFVYGSLIQGVAPDEACMVSAFDGDRSSWEPSWRACVETHHGHKSQGNNTETLLQSRSGSKASHQITRQGFSQSEVPSSPAGRASNKAIPSPVLNPMIPLSSPLWSISTPSCDTLPSSSIARSVFDYQAISPLQPYQTPPIRNFVAHTTSWPSQAPLPVHWLASSQSSPFDISLNYSAFPIMEPVKLTPVKQLSSPISSGKKHVYPIPGTHTGATTIFAGTSSLVDLKKVTVSTSQTSADTKTRKRKKPSGAEGVVQISVTASLADTVSAPVVDNHLSMKAPAAEDLSQVSFLARNQADSVSATVANSHYSTSVAVKTTSSFVPKSTSNHFFSAATPSSGHLKRGDLSVDKWTLNLDCFSKVEEAKLQAEEAATHAAAAVSHCQGVWSQLNQQKNSGLTSDAEAKIASAAASIAAAASVAKAAAAAAKIASTAAVQAKQMADEAVTKNGTVNITEYGTMHFVNNSTTATPVSILKSGDKNNTSSLAISAAREAAKKRIEAAEAATRHAQNLDAIVKAAELAAEAVSHAGKIVAMGDPFPLGEPVEAGPDVYWKVLQVASVPGSKLNVMNKNISSNSNVGEVLMLPIQRELSQDMMDDYVTVEESLTASVKHGEKKSKTQKDKRASDSAKATGIVSEPDIESRSNSLIPCTYESTTSIKEGSPIEVLKDRGNLKNAWFSGNVLDLKDGEALVCYIKLQSDEGLEQLKEWVSLKAKDGSAPIARIPHPMTAVQLQGTRKRRQAEVKDYTWSVGDRVDAWVHDCWREGIIAEKNEKDATKLSVHFPAQAETLIVKLWNLRPTVIWRDGRWIEWCRPGHDGTCQGDTPVQKRLKLRSTGIETIRKGKMAKNFDFAETRENEEPSLPLSTNEKVFNIGSTRDENNPSMARTMRSGLQKEGSRVIFGVPKPGKKRKFMEVSKHYVSDKTNVPNDSVKLSKFLMPQGSESRGWKNNSKINMKEKQGAESKPKALRSGKPPSIPSRNIARKDDSISSRPNASDSILSDYLAKGSISNDENESGEQNLTECGSFSNVEETSGGTMVFFSQALSPEDRKKSLTRNNKSEWLNKEKLASASGNSGKREANEKFISEVAEPRRSNRQIHPTSRLLEGLQSSLIISKIPSTSHEKSHRTTTKGTSRGNIECLVSHWLLLSSSF